MNFNATHEAVRNILSTDIQMHHTNNQVFQLTEAFTQHINHQTDIQYKSLKLF